MPEASVVIVTRNRKEKALVAVQSALAQEGDIEVLVIDDGSTDGTAEFLRQRCPRARVERSEQQRGYIVQRSRAGQLATAPVLFSIDDDAEFGEPTTVKQAAAAFDDPIVGAVAVPHVNVSPDGSASARLLPRAPDDGRAYVLSTFIGTAYAVRRDVFNRFGCFQNYLYHWGEEVEFCQRLFGGGYLVRLVETPEPIRHYPGWQGKYTRQITRYIYRNKILSVWLNAPLRYLLPLAAVQTASSFAAVLRGQDTPLAVLEGLAMGYGASIKGAGLRHGIPAGRFRAWAQIHRRRIVPLEEARAMLAATAGATAVEPAPAAGATPSP